MDGQCDWPATGDVLRQSANFGWGGLLDWCWRLDLGWSEHRGRDNNRCGQRCYPGHSLWGARCWQSVPSDTPHHNVTLRLQVGGPKLRYIFLIYLDEDELAGLDRQLRHDGKDEMLSFASDLERSGHAVAHLLLEPPSTAVFVRSVDGGAIKSSRGSALQRRKHPLRWVLIVEATDEEQAKQFASRLPVPSGTMVEVRPVTWVT